MSKWCQDHWDKMREDAEARGLGPLISANGEIMAMKMQAELKEGLAGNEEQKEDFDPLMRVFWMIESRALEVIGLAVMTPDFGCPICFLNSYRTDDGRCPCNNADCDFKEPGSVPDHETWIVGEGSATEAVALMCRERGWI